MLAVFLFIGYIFLFFIFLSVFLKVSDWVEDKLWPKKKKE